MSASTILWIIIIGGLVFWMMRRGGCGMVDMEVMEVTVAMAQVVDREDIPGMNKILDGEVPG